MNQTYDLTPDMLRIIRNAEALTQQQLADLVSVDRSTITKMEAGERSITPEIRRRLELALGWNEPELQDMICSIQTWKEAVSNG